MAEAGPSRSGAAKAAARKQLDVEIVREADAWERVGDTLLVRGAKAAFAAVSPRDDDCEVAILLTSDAKMRELNREWRGKDAPTNVLSFPSGDERHLGDVVLAYETIAREAKEQGVTIEDHAAHLVVHGLLHLLGYDHAMEKDAGAMEALETSILATLGIADPYAEASLSR
jgi:probable rRNA maturation factor